MTQPEPTDDRAAEMATATATELPATNVIEALRRVIRDLPAIGKEGTGPSSQGSYKYRGIEQITKHAAPLFARHGLVMAPNAIVWKPTREIMVNGKPNTDESLLVTYRVYGPGGVEDYIEVQAPGIGRDSSDKGSNKAMTAAYKYALTQMLAVADAKDDNDAHHDDADAPPDDPYEPLVASRPQMDTIRGVCRTLRERGMEVTETNDEGEVRVLDVKLLKRTGPDTLLPAITEDEATALIGRLNATLADLLLEGGDAAPVAASAPPAATPAPAQPEPGTEAQAVAEQQQARATAAAAAQAALDVAGATDPQPAIAPAPPANEGAGQLRGSKEDDEHTTKAKAHVNKMDLTAVRAACADSGIDLPPSIQPAALRRRLADAIAARLRENVQS